MDTLPDEILHEIILRLPMTTLLQCQLVNSYYFKGILDDKFLLQKLGHKYNLPNTTSFDEFFTLYKMRYCGKNMTQLRPIKRVLNYVLDNRCVKMLTYLRAQGLITSEHLIFERYISRNDLDTLKFLVASGFNPSANSLTMAMIKNDYPIIVYLLQLKAPMNEHTMNRAVIIDNMMKLFLDHGYTIPIDNSALVLAISNYKWSNVEILLAAGHSLHIHVDNNPLIFRFICSLEIVHKLIELGYDVNVRNHRNDTILNAIMLSPPIISSTLTDRLIPTIDFFLQKGIDINARDIDGHNVLDIAIIRIRGLHIIHIIQYLIQQGVSTTLHVLAHNRMPYYNRKVDYDKNRIVLRNRFLDIINLLNSDINALDDNGDTSLHVALRQHNYVLAEILIEKGADCNICNNQGNTPLHITSQSDDLDVNYIYYTVWEKENAHIRDLLISSGANNEGIPAFVTD